MVRPDAETHSTVWQLLRDLSGTDPLKELFWSQLNYQRINEPISRRGWPALVSEALTESPVLFAAGGQDDAFQVIYCRLASEKLRRGLQRPVISRLLRDHPYALFVFSNEPQDRWHFVNVKFAEDHAKRRLHRRITVGPEEKLRTASERIAMLDLALIGPGLFGLSPLDIQARHDEAFDVEAVTKLFFDDYKAVFRALWEDLEGQTDDRHWAHDCALQFLNRCMFLYFVQRKRWLGDDPDFLASFWRAYDHADRPKDTFFGKWLSVLFFEAFNDRFHGGHSQFPDAIHDALQMAPFLNGGLFKEDPDLDGKYDFNITDARFRQVFTFLERYNFTIAEDSPIDQEVAVDPEMIGKVYESLVHVSEEADERGEAGIFYTPRTEIDLMCRLSLVDNLANNVSEKHKNLFYEAVFALEQREKEPADKALHKAGLWPKVAEHLRRITVADPACGSGSFLVGMLHILDDLQERAGEYLGHTEEAYDRRKRIIGRNLYGVDVMEWACHVAELRLWLALIIDAEIPLEERSVRAEPLLPYFTFKIRCGDSLVQEVGGVNMSHRRANVEIPRNIKARLTRLQKAKLAYYDNRPLEGFESESAIKNEELRIFRDLLDEQTVNLQNEAKRLMRIQAERPHRQMTLTGEQTPAVRQLSLDREAREKQIQTLMEETEQVKQTRDALRHTQDVPLVWDIAFAEVMESDTGGFDIVVGNPPYVRQESIADPHMPREQVTTANKKQYKAKLARSVYQVWPRFFGYKRTSTGETVGHKINAKSDLYIYFYFHGLSLLNEKGSFCFITSNSWLDVGYGKDLQEFLLKHSHVKFVLDNQVKRSFAAADVNTIIALFSRPEDRRQEGLQKTARFVMFKAPFEQVLSPVIFEEIEDAKARKSSEEYRVFPVSQEDLLKDGCEVMDDEEEGEAVAKKRRSSKTRGPLIKVAKYIGNKWGGKYLRAPNIYWTIMDKGQGFLRCLGEYFEGERYLNTGGADGFFILRQVTHGSKTCYRIRNDSVISPNREQFSGEIEKEYLVPLVKDATKDDKRIEINGYDAYCLVVRGTPSRKLRAYIKWGEQQGYNQRSVTKHQRPWYKPTNQMLSAARVLVPRSFNDTFVIHYNPREFLSLRFYRLHLQKGDELPLLGYLNSTLIAFFLEVLGNKNLGQGVLDFFMADFLSLRIPVVDVPDLESAFLKIKERAILPVWEEYGVASHPDSGQKLTRPPADRTELDGIVFDILRLTKGEREAVYEAVIDLVENRLGKAKSLKKKG